MRRDPRRCTRSVICAVGIALVGCSLPSPRVALPAPQAGRVRLVPQTLHFRPSGTRFGTCAVLTPRAELYTAASDSTWKRWDAKTGLLVESIPVPVETGCAFTPDGRYLVGGTWDGNIHIISTTSRAVVRTIKGYGIPWSVAISANGEVVAASNPRGFQSWDLATGEKLADEDLGVLAETIALSPDGSRLALGESKHLKGSDERPIPLLVDARTGAVLFTETDRAALVGVGSDGSFAAPPAVEVLVASGAILSASGEAVAIDAKEVPLVGAGAPRRLPCEPVAFDAEIVVCGDPLGPFDFVSADTGRRTNPGLDGRNAPISAADFSPDSRYLYLADTSGHAWAWDLETLSIERELPWSMGSSTGGTETNPEAALSPDGTKVLTSGGLFDAATGAVLGRTSSEGGGWGEFLGVAWSPDNTHFAAMSFSGEEEGPGLTIHDGTLAKPNDELLNPEPLSTSLRVPGSFARFAFRPSGGQLVALTLQLDKPSSIVSFDPASGQQLQSVETPGRTGSALAFSSDGSAVYVAYAPLSFESLQETVATGEDRAMEGFTLSGRGSIVRVDPDDLGSEKPIGTHDRLVTALEVDSTGTRLASGGMDGLIKVWDLAGATPIAQLDMAGTFVTAVAFSPDGRFVVGAGSNGTTKIFRLTDGAAITLLGWSEWLAYDERGYFDASAGGGNLAAAYVDGHITRVEAIAREFNRPDKVMESIGLGTPSTRSDLAARADRRNRRLAGTADSGARPPSVAIKSIQQRGKLADVTISATDEKGLSAIHLYANGVPVFGALGRSVSGSAQETTFALELEAGANKIEVGATDTDGLESTRELRTIVHDGVADRDLYFVAFGVSRYDDPSLMLAYAAKDATDLAAAIRSVAGFREVHALTFVDDQVSVSALERVRTLLSTSNADDVVMVFVAGHGQQLMAPDPHYVFLPSNAVTSDLARTGIPFSSFEGLFDGIGARKRVLLMDTCESGEYDVAAGPGRGSGLQLIPRGSKRVKLGDGDTPSPLASPVSSVLAPTYDSTRARFVDADLRRRSGAVVLSSSRGSEQSFEVEDLKNGVFTEALLEGLSSAKDSGVVDRATGEFREGLSLESLRSHVSTRVAAMTGGLQHPTIDRDNLDVRFAPLFTRLTMERP